MFTADYYSCLLNISVLDDGWNLQGGLIKEKVIFRLRYVKVDKEKSVGTVIFASSAGMINLY